MINHLYSGLLSIIKHGLFLFTSVVLLSCAPNSQQPFDASYSTALKTANADDLMIVDCLLPGKIKRIGQMATYISKPRPIKTSAVNCGIRGGSYVAYDRSNYQTARKVWLATAQQGDKKSQNYLGEIYEKGLGTAPDYKTAAKWYELSAKQGFAAAQINIGKLYEAGLGVAKDMTKALYWYRQASGLSDLIQNQIPVEQQSDGAGPTIEIIEPLVPPTRGIILVQLEPNVETRLIKGRISSKAGLAKLRINNKEVSFNQQHYFESDVDISEGGSRVTIVAVDKRGRKATRSIILKPAKKYLAEHNFGRYHALVIGNNNYDYLNSLQTPISDAKAISKILKEKYGFHVTTLLNQNRSEILNALSNLRAKLNSNDNLLIYYAGHGEIDKQNNRGHWLPVDAETERRTNWISNVALTDILHNMTIKHILVVADSCYSGTLTRSVLTSLKPGLSDEALHAYYQSISSKRSRTALTSGGIKPVLDAGSNGHSVFANAFISILNSNNDVLEGADLAIYLKKSVHSAASNKRFEQVPEYAPIDHSGHEAGDFLFIPVS